MKILYFAWLRSKIGYGEEDVDPPVDVASLDQLVDWLKTRSPGHTEAFANKALVRAAINQDFARFDQTVSPGDEVAFFPPVTGGAQ